MEDSRILFSRPQHLYQISKHQTGVTRLIARFLCRKAAQYLSIFELPSS
jgi:serine/threonine protein phosphatase PrpC